MERFARPSVALALIGVLAACANSGGSASSSSSAAGSAQASASAAAPAASAAAPAASVGEKVYNQDCSSCHQPNGQGVQGTFPPLVGNPTVTGYDIHVIHIVKYGLSGPITVGGVQYNGMMPAWTQSLSNGDIAAVLTYVRSAWGNKARPISESRVAAVHKSME
ncbi:MAG TPA: cytochrome c [Candidatus Acidoferrum sp.]|nr:cytochrome c [Candidatus Acidoferrum sp.]